MSTAVDFLHCLHCLRRSLAQKFGNRIDVQLHSYAQMGLIRGAVENAYCAVWLLGPPQRERVLNRLMLEWHELKPAHRLRELTRNTPPRTIEQRQQQLIELLLAADQELTGDVEQRIAVDVRSAIKALRGFDYMTMVKGAGDLTPGVGPDLSETAWRMCSALAHGGSSATIGLLAKEVVEQSEPGVKLVRPSRTPRGQHRVPRLRAVRTPVRAEERRVQLTGQENGPPTPADQVEHLTTTLRRVSLGHRELSSRLQRREIIQQPDSVQPGKDQGLRANGNVTSAAPHHHTITAVDAEARCRPRAVRLARPSSVGPSSAGTPRPRGSPQSEAGRQRVRRAAPSPQLQCRGRTPAEGSPR